MHNFLKKNNMLTLNHSFLLLLTLRIALCLGNVTRHRMAHHDEPMPTANATALEGKSLFCEVLVNLHKLSEPNTDLTKPSEPSAKPE